MKKILFAFVLILAVILSGCTVNFTINTNLGKTPTPVPTSTPETDNRVPHTFETVTVTQKELVGNWTIDQVYTEAFTGKSLQEMYGSAYGTSGCGMEFGNDDSFSYYIASRIGGEGSYKVSKDDYVLHEVYVLILTNLLSQTKRLSVKQRTESADSSTNLIGDNIFDKRLTWHHKRPLHI